MMMMLTVQSTATPQLNGKYKFNSLLNNKPTLTSMAHLPCSDLFKPRMNLEPRHLNPHYLVFFFHITMCRVIVLDDGPSMFHFHLSRCYTLEKAPFTACNKHINPESFISACIRTLCKYPAVDGLKCQLLEAYARACSQHSNVTVEGWRSNTSCCKAVFPYLQLRFKMTKYELLNCAE